MTIENQIRIVSRVRRDLVKEAHQHREDANSVAATDCEELASALKEVETTLKDLKATLSAFRNASRSINDLLQLQAGGGQ